MYLCSQLWLCFLKYLVDAFQLTCSLGFFKAVLNGCILKANFKNVAELHCLYKLKIGKNHVPVYYEWRNNINELLLLRRIECREPTETSVLFKNMQKSQNK